MSEPKRVVMRLCDAYDRQMLAVKTLLEEDKHRVDIVCDYGSFASKNPDVVAYGPLIVSNSQVVVDDMFPVVDVCVTTSPDGLGPDLASSFANTNVPVVLLQEFPNWRMHIWQPRPLSKVLVPTESAREPWGDVVASVATGMPAWDALAEVKKASPELLSVLDLYNKTLVFVAGPKVGAGGVGNIVNAYFAKAHNMHIVGNIHPAASSEEIKAFVRSLYRDHPHLTLLAKNDEQERFFREAAGNRKVDIVNIEETGKKIGEAIDMLSIIKASNVFIADPASTMLEQANMLGVGYVVGLVTNETAATYQELSGVDISEHPLAAANYIRLFRSPDEFRDPQRVIPLPEPSGKCARAVADAIIMTTR